MSDFSHTNLPKTDGDVRRLILEQIVGISEGSVSVPEALAKAALFKELNNSLNNAINSAKLSIVMEDRGRDFVKTARLGQQIVSESLTE